MEKVLASSWAYLKDWRNWLSHGLVGLGQKVPDGYICGPIYRIIILILIIGFNITRMKLSEKGERSPSTDG